MSYTAPLVTASVAVAMEEADRRVSAVRRAKARKHHVARVRAAIVAELYRLHPAPATRPQLCNALRLLHLPLTRQGLDRHLPDLLEAGVLMEYGRAPRAGKTGFGPMQFCLSPAFLDHTITQAQGLVARA